MNRRSLFGFPICAFFALLFAGRPRRQAAEPAAGPATVTVGPWPTMEQLINLAEAETNEPTRLYYAELLTRALLHTGPVASDTDGFAVVYYRHRPILGEGTSRCFFRKAAEVAVPGDLLCHFRPANRGEEFPPGVPYRPLP
jgi:hypothetical protein